uniref:G-protein coupled receptors family 1 profile domain-containing protein n=1 Tax=Strigamia maritima TaxID=126957 RepID=T1ISI9_STRMM
MDTFSNRSNISDDYSTFAPLEHDSGNRTDGSLSLYAMQILNQSKLQDFITAANETSVVDIINGTNTLWPNFDQMLNKGVSSPQVPTVGGTDWEGSMYPSGYSTLRIILTAIFVTSLMIVIVVGNMLVIIAIVTEKTLKTIQNWFIASLAVSDFLVGLVVMPFSLANELMGYWIFGSWWCEIHQAVDVLLCTASILNICMISLDRYWSITKAVEYLKQRTPMRAAIMIFLVWIVSFVISVPPLLGWKKPQKVHDYPECEVSDEMGYVIYSSLGSFYIPSVVMVFVYIRIYIAARSRARRVMKRRNVMETAKDKSTTTTSFSNASPPDRTKSSSKSAMLGTPGAGDTLVVPALTPASTPSPDRRKESPVSPITVVTDESIVAPTDEASEAAEAKGCGNGTAKAVKPISVAVPKTPPATTVTSPGGPSSTVEPEDCISEMEHSSDSDQYRESKSSRTEVDESQVPLKRLRHLCRPPKKKGASKERREEVDLGRVAPKIRDPEREKRRIARKRERRATLILGLIMASFILSWLPFFMLYLLNGICRKSCDIPDLAFATAFWLGYVNSALNPIIYTIFNKDFRRAFRKILFK